MEKPCHWKSTVKINAKNQRWKSTLKRTLETDIAKMSDKRTQQVTRPRKGGKGTAPSEIVVQRLTAEPDNKQAYRPVQPREFVEFSSEDLTLENLKIACAEHFGYPVNSCDVLVSNKGPSCTNINQIPHRKDKVSKRLVVYWENCQMHQIDLIRPETHKGLKRVARVQYSWIFTFTRSRLSLLLLSYL